MWKITSREAQMHDKIWQSNVRSEKKIPSPLGGIQWLRGQEDVVRGPKISIFVHVQG